MSARLWGICGAAGLALIVALLVVGGGNSRTAISSERAEALAPSYLAEQPGDAARLALAGYRLDPSTQGELSMATVAADSAGVRRVIETGSHRVDAVDWSSHLLVTASGDGRFAVWRPATGVRLGTTRSADVPLMLADSPSTPVLAVLDRSGRVELLDLSDPDRPRLRPLALLHHRSKPLAIGWSETGAVLYIAYTDAAIVEIEATTGRELGSWSLRSALSSGSTDGDPVRLATAAFDARTPAGDEHLLVATPEGAVVRIQLGSRAARLMVPPGEVPGHPTAVAEKPFGAAIAVAATHGLLTKESAKTTSVIVHGIGFKGVVFDSEGRLWSADRDGVYSQSTPGFTLTSRYAGRPAGALFAGRGGVVAIDPGGAVSLLGPPGVGIAFNSTPYSSVASFGPKGRLLIAESLYGSTYGMNLLRPGYKYENGAAQANPEVRSYELSSSWVGHSDRRPAIDNAAIDRELVAAGGQDGAGRSALFFWRKTGGRPLKELELSSGDLNPLSNPVITAVTLIPRHHLVAAYSTVQQTVSVWSTETWQLVASVPVLGLSSLALSPDEQELVAVSRPGKEIAIQDGEAHSTLIFLDPESGAVRQEVRVGDVTAAAWSPDGDELALADSDATLRLRSADGTTELRPPIYLPAEPTALAWRPDGAELAVGLAEEGTALVDPRSGALTPALPGKEYITVRHLDWSPDGKVLAAAATEENSHGHEVPAAAEIWKIGAGQLQRRMCELAGGPTSSRTWDRLIGDDAEPRRLCRSGARRHSSLGPGDAALLEPAAVVAFRRKDELFAADEQGHVVRIGRVEGDGFPEVRGAWDGDSFAWSSAGEIGLLTAGRSRALDLPCSCSGLAWNRGRLFTVSDDGRGLLRLSGGKWAGTSISGLGQAPRLLGFLGDRAVVVAYASEPYRGTPSTFYLVDREGAATPIARDRYGAAFGPSAQATDRDVIAFTSIVSGGACFSPARIGILRRRPDGSVELTYPAMPPEPGPAAVESLEVDEAGAVEASIGPLGCGEGESLESPPAATRYVLEENAWRRTADRGFDAQRSEDGLLARITDPKAYGEGGRLTLASGESERQIGGGVEQMWLRGK
jgi:WD40 repeat protein